MPVFTYEGFDTTGAQEIGTIDASTERLAFDILKSRGVSVVELTEGVSNSSARKPWYLRDIGFGSTKLGYQDQAQTAELLAVLFEARLSSK